MVPLQGLTEVKEQQGTLRLYQAKLNMKERDVQIVMYLAIIVLLNVAAATLSVRFDLTRNDTYSLSERSREVVSGLQEDMKIKVFFSARKLLI